MSAILRLNNLRLQARLGCFPSEKKSPQTVRLDIEIEFASPPKGCRTDLLADTLDYGSLAQELKEVGLTRHFDLVEKLADAYLARIVRVLPPGARLTLTLTKEKVPLPARGRAIHGIAIKGGVSFSLIHLKLENSGKLRP